MRGEVHILVYCPIDTFQWGSTHSALFTHVCNFITQEKTGVIWIWFMWLWSLNMPSLTKSYFEFSLIFKFLMRKALSHVNSLKAVQSLKNYLYSFLYKAWRQIEDYLYKACFSSGSYLGKNIRPSGPLCLLWCLHYLYFTRIM